MKRVYVTTVFNTVELIVGSEQAVRQRLREMGSVVRSVQDASTLKVNMCR